MKRRDVLKAGIFAGGLRALGGGVANGEILAPASLTLVFGGLCAYVRLQENSKPVCRALLMNPRCDPALHLPPHDPVLVFRTNTDPQNPEYFVPEIAATWIRTAYKLPATQRLECRRLSGTHVIIDALQGGGAIDFGKANDLARLSKVIASPVTRPDVLTAELHREPIVLGSVLLVDGTVKDGETANPKARMAEWEFRPGVWKQKVSESLEFMTDAKQEYFELKGVGKNPFTIRITPGNSADAWILNMPIKKHAAGSKALYHFAAYYNVLSDAPSPLERPIPHTCDVVVTPLAPAAAAQSSQGLEQERAKYLGDVYCPGGGP